MRRVVAGRGVGGDADHLLQEGDLFVEVRVDPAQQFFFASIICSVGPGAGLEPGRDLGPFGIRHVGEIRQRHGLQLHRLLVDARRVLADAVGSSSITPAGAVAKPGWVGCAAWQETQRWSMMPFTAANCAPGRQPNDCR
jgi:hypothetical protein